MTKEPLIFKIKFYHVAITHLISLIVGTVLGYHIIDAYIPTAITFGVAFASVIQIILVCVVCCIDKYNERNF